MANALGARLNSKETLGDRVIKVDHAGEHGAICIYSAQLFIARWRCPSLTQELEEFLTHERRHRNLFSVELKRRGRRRCRSYHWCGVGGVMLGLVTGLIGPRAIHATTEAIERVVLRHLEEQLVVLDPLDAQAAGAIRAIIADEQLHHDTAFDQLGGQRGMLDRTIDRVVSASTELVIWLGMKL